MHIYKPFFRFYHREEKEDQPDDLNLEIQYQKLAEEYALELVNKSAILPVSLTKVLLHLQKLLLLQPTLLQQITDPFQKPLGL